MLSLRIAGQPFREHGPITVEYGPHGCEAAAWQMEPLRRHPLVRGRARVDVYDGGLPIWAGTLDEPGSDGMHTAKGLWHQAETIPALDAALAFSTVPNTAIDAAISRGEVSWTRPSSLSTAAWAPNATELTLAALLDGYAAENALRWWVDGTAAVRMAAEPTVPMWHVPHAVAGRGLTPAEDEFATHLVGRFLNAATNTYLSATVGSASAASHFGRRTVQVDLSPMGGIDSTRATSVLNGMFLRAGARMGWAEPLELAYGQITTPGGSLAPLNQIQSMQMVRLAGTVDTSRANMLKGYQDVVLATSRYTDGSGVIRLSPLGYAPRNLREVLTLAVAG